MPTGPWGEGFPQCEAYIMRRRSWSRERAKRYCGGIYQEQRKAGEDYPHTARQYTTQKVWRSFPDTLNLPDDVTISITNQEDNAMEKIFMRVSRPDKDASILHEILTSILDNEVRSNTEIIWDIAPRANEVILYEGPQKQNHVQLFKSNYPEYPDLWENPLEIYLRFAAHALAKGGGLQVQPTLGGHPVEVHVKDDTVKVYGPESIPDTILNELRTAKISSAILKGSLLSDCVILDDISMRNGEPLTEKGYLERYAALKSTLPTLTHWRIVESYPVSSLASFRGALEKANDENENRGITVKGDDEANDVAYLHPCPECIELNLEECIFREDPDICPVLREVAKSGGASWPKTCKAAAFYRCPYIQSIYYSEVNVK